MDLTTKRCRSKTLALAKKLEEFYEKNFATPADDAFWLAIEELDDELARQFAIPKITSMEIDKAVDDFGRGFKKATSEALARAS